MSEPSPAARPIYVLAPRPGAPLDAGWKDAVAALPGVDVLGRDGIAMRIAASAGGLAAVRALGGGALRVERVRARSPGAAGPAQTE